MVITSLNFSSIIMREVGLDNLTFRLQHLAAEIPCPHLEASIVLVKYLQL